MNTNPLGGSLCGSLCGSNFRLFRAEFDLLSLFTGHESLKSMKTIPRTMHDERVQ